ncbi:MAG: hypothetical protein FWD62_14725 [Betaproteobacteria bacterium]|nr:hypothetical protein [Betaproteobacteria bacterium]
MNRSLATVIALTIPLGLALDQWGGRFGQPLVNLWVVALFGWMLWREAGMDRLTMLACLLIAGLGECVLALLWGLYDYRQSNLPLFVPPGHVLLFWLGVYLSTRIPASWLACVPPLASVAVALGHDTLSLPLLALYLLCWRFGPTPRLYSTMFVLALAMELWGTALGNWAWRATVPGLGWPAANPPLAAGAFYCALDLLVLGVVRKRSAVLQPALEANR